MATQDPAKACVPILKNAAALDAKLKAGDESVKDECVRLYGEGLVMLERAVSAGTYSDKVKAALGKKSTMVRKRLDALGAAPGPAAPARPARSPKGAAAGKAKAKAAPAGAAGAKKGAKGTAAKGKGKATAGATASAAKPAARKKQPTAAKQPKAAGKANAASPRAAKAKAASPRAAKATAASPKAAKAKAAKAATSKAGTPKAATPRADTSVKQSDPAKLCVPILKAAAAEDAKFKNGDDSVLEETVRLYEEGLQLLEQAVEWARTLTK